MKRLIIAAALCACAALAEAASPRIAVVSGPDKRHADEFDLAIEKLGWKVSGRFVSSEASMKQLVEKLDSYDMILMTPLFNYRRPRVMPGDDRAAYMKFLENGGMIVITEGSYGHVRDWVADLDPRFKGLEEGKCNSSQWNIAGRTIDADPPHPMRFFPWKIGEPNSWAHLQKLPKDSNWKLVASCNEGFPVTVCQRVGKGILYFTSVRQTNERQFDNFFANLQLARAGIELKSFSMPDPAMGPGKIEAVLSGTFEGTCELVYTVTNDKGREAVFSSKNEGNVIEIAYVHASRGKITETLTLKYDGKEVPLLTRSSELPQLFALRPNAYRGILSTKRRVKKVKFGIELEPYKENLSKGRVELSVWLNGETNVASETVQLSTNLVRRILHPMTLEKDLPAGNYKLKGKLFAANDDKLAEAETSFKILAPRLAQTIIDEDNTFLVNGRPFFPIGIYHMSPSDYARGKELGFNTVTFWAWHEDYDSFGLSRGLARATAYGLRTIFELNHKGKNVVREKALAHRDNPALFMWYGLDEPSESSYAQAKMMQDVFHLEDEQHPVYTLSCRDDVFAEQAQFADAFGIDPYGNPDKVLNWTTNALSALDGKKPLIVVPASFSGTNPEIYRSELYIALAEGARGVLWYPWSQAGGGPLGVGLKNHPEMQNVVSQLCQEVRMLMPALTAVDRRSFTSKDGAIRAMYMNDGGVYTLLFVNSTANTVKAKMSVPGLGKWECKMRDHFKKNGKAEFFVRDGVFEIELKPYETRAFTRTWN